LLGRGGEDPVDDWIPMHRGRRRSLGGGDLDNDQIEDARRRIGEDEGSHSSGGSQGGRDHGGFQNWSPMWMI